MLRLGAQIIGAAILVILAVVCVTNPTVGIFALAGVLVWGLLRRRARPTRGILVRVAVLGAISVGFLAGLVWLVLSDSTPNSDVADPGIRRVGYSASATLDGGRDVWRVEESLALDDQDLRAIGATRADRSTRSLRRIRRELAAGLAEDGWSVAPDQDGRFVLERARDVPLRERRWPPMTVNLLAIGALSLPPPYSSMALAADRESVATLVTPKAAVHETYPAATGREDRLLDDGTEEVSVPLGQAALDPAAPEIRAEVVAPWLRLQLTQPLADLSFQAALKWIVLGVLALFSGWIKRNILEPLFDRFARRARIPRIPAEPQPGGAPPSR